MGERANIQMQSQYDRTTPLPKIHSEWNSIWYLLEASMDVVRGWELLLELPLCLLPDYRSSQEKGGGSMQSTEVEQSPSYELAS